MIFLEEKQKLDTRTVQDPHPPSAQPSFVPVNPFLLRKLISDSSGSGVLSITLEPLIHISNSLRTFMKKILTLTASTIRRQSHYLAQIYRINFKA